MMGFDANLEAVQPSKTFHLKYTAVARPANSLELHFVFRDHLLFTQITKVGERREAIVVLIAFIHKLRPLMMICCLQSHNWCWDRHYGCRPRYKYNHAVKMP